ncbi:MAG: hypothetical protein H6743_03795 [Rickettsiaceae bacterium]|nr:hypothetical protein [Rickettsiaceae bacterium]
MVKQAREKIFTTKWQKWARANSKKLPRAYAWEAKVSSSTDAISFNAVQEHQIQSLKIAKWYCFVYKLSDLDRMQKPCDGVTISGAGLLIFHWHYKIGRSYNKEFFIIDIDRFVQEKEESNRLSLTEDRAREIAMLVGTLA